jgi:hypothetical protein
MADTVTQQIVSESPAIEAYKLGLLQSAQDLSKKPLDLSGAQQQVSGMSQDQTTAMNNARAGIGAYQPYLNSANQNLAQGTNYINQGAGVLANAATPTQFAAAQAAENLAGNTANQLGGIASQAGQGYNFMNQAGSLANANSQANLTGAQGLLNTGAQGLQQAQNLALASSGANYGQAQNLMNQGISQFAGATDTYDPNSASAYMNPYQQQVVQNAMQEINRQKDISSNQLNAKAVASGAFGGSRNAIEQSELYRNTQQLQNQTIASLMSQGYTQAQAQAQQNFQAQNQAQLAAGQGINQAAALSGSLATQQAQLGQSGANAAGQLSSQQANIGSQLGQQNLAQAGLGQQAAQNLSGIGTQYGALAGQQANILGNQAGLYNTIGQGIGNLANQQFAQNQSIASGLGTFGTQAGNLGVQQGALGQTQQQLNAADVSQLYNVGQQQQNLSQNQLDASRNNALQAAYQPYQGISFLSDIYKGAPSTQQSVSSATAPTPSAITQAAGLGIAGLAAGTGAAKAGLF